jgi:hypothetical protein
MVKTLRITTILIALAALGFIIFIAAKGIASDEGIEKFLAAPGVAEQLQAGSPGQKASDGEQETPLIRQAKSFALRIDPPPPPAPVAPKITAQNNVSPSPKVAVAAKFTLIGTSYYAGDEKNSWALINEVGKGWHWVKQGDKAGHLIVEKIGDGVVLIRDGSNTYELSAERKQKADYVKSFTGIVASGKTVPVWQGAENAVTQVEALEQSPISSTETTQTVQTVSPEVTKENVQENIEWVKQLQKNPESLGMTAEEVKELDGLGEMLQTLEAEVKTIESNEPNAAGESGLVKTKPNSTENSDTVETADANEQNSPEINEPRRPERDGNTPRSLRERRRRG